MQEKSSDLAAAIANLSELNARNTTLGETVGSANAELDKLNVEIEAKKAERDRIRNEAITAASQRDVAKTELQEKSSDLAAAIANLSELNARNTTLGETVGSANAELDKPQCRDRSKES